MSLQLRPTARRGINPFLSIVFLLSFLHFVVAFDMTRSDNLAVYWGQNSYGAVHPNDSKNFQQRLSAYCGPDSTIDALPIAFLNTFFSEGGLPSVELSNICNPQDDATFAGTELPICSTMAADIRACQAAGKLVTLSLGGGASSVGFQSDSQARSFADTVFNIFLGGNSDTRPFGDAILDGIDLDIEAGGPTGYAAFITQLRARAAAVGQTVVITGAPQCPFPDAALGGVINAVPFDALYVQFYNNYCGLQAYNNPNDWNFGTWDNWAHTTSLNKNVKIYLGAPASSTAAGSGYVDAGTFASIIKEVKSKYSSFGGVMMWDVSQAYANNRYDVAVKNALTGGAAPPPPPPPKSTSTIPSTTVAPPRTSTVSPTPTPTQTVGSGSCAGVPAWSSSIAYNGGAQVVYNGHLWTAKWWSEADVPGGVAQDWQDMGPCSSSKIVVPAFLPGPSSGKLPLNTGSRIPDATSTPNADATRAPDAAASAKHPRAFRE